MNTPHTWSDSPIHEQIRTMNDTPTPDTDEHEFPCMTWPSQDHPMVVRAAFARKLERERDEAREETIRTREFMDHGFAKAQEELAAVTEQRDEAREQLAEIEDKMRVELGGHPNSKLWGEAGLIAATMRCVDALDEVTEQRDRLAEALQACREDSVELLGERCFWQNEPRCDYDKRYQETRNNVTRADEALQSLTPKSQ